jgi:competence protein ComEA
MIRLVASLFAVAAMVAAQPQLVDGPGRAEVEKVCKGCHEIQRSISKRQDRAAWVDTLNKMVALGTKATDAELSTIADYLAKHYGAGELAPVNINEAEAIELESRLSLRRSQAGALIAHRKKNGKFKTLDDVKKVPGIDAAKLDAKKDQIVF